MGLFREQHGLGGECERGGGHAHVDVKGNLALQRQAHLRQVQQDLARHLQQRLVAAAQTHGAYGSGGARGRTAATARAALEADVCDDGVAGAARVHLCLSPAGRAHVHIARLLLAAQHGAEVADGEEPAAADDVVGVQHYASAGSGGRTRDVVEVLDDGGACHAADLLEYRQRAVDDHGDVVLR